MFRFLPSGAGDLFDYAGTYPLKAGSYFLKIDCSACRLGGADSVSYSVSLDLTSPSRSGDAEPNDAKVVPYGGGDFPVYIVANGAELYSDKPGSGSEAQTWSLVLGDLSGLRGLEIYAGFGRSANDMLAKGQAKMVYRVD